MMKNMTRLLMPAVVAAIATTSSANVWRGNQGDQWGTSANWTDDANTGADKDAPTLTDDAYIFDYGFVAPKISVPGAVANSVFLGRWALSGVLTVEAAGTLTTAGALVVANEPGLSGSVVNNGQITVGASTYLHSGTGSFENNGTLNTVDLVLGNMASSVSTFTNTGTITATGAIYLALTAGSSCTFNMNGGTVNTPLFFMNQAGTGHLNLNGGTFNVGALGLDGSANNTLDVTEGIMVVDGDRSADLNYVALLGYITAYGGAGTVIATYDSGSNKTTLSGALNNYASWAAEWPGIGSETNDPDGDLLDNLGEYGLGGNPTNAADRGMVPTFVKDGSNMLYVHVQRTGNANLSYHLETTGQLSVPAWTNSGYFAVTNVTGNLFDYVTNTIPATADEIFIRLRIENN